MVDTPSERIVEGVLHDLTRPLIVIREQGQRLSREGLPRRGVHDLASSITKLSEDALTILDRLVEGGGFERDGAVASAPLAEVLARVSGALERLHLGRRIPAPGRVPSLHVGSPADLVSVLVNLVDNALRATRPADAVWLVHDPTRVGWSGSRSGELSPSRRAHGGSDRPRIQARFRDPCDDPAADRLLRRGFERCASRRSGRAGRSMWQNG
jgi:signal transduction histidine kinase